MKSDSAVDFSFQHFVLVKKKIHKAQVQYFLVRQCRRHIVVASRAGGQDQGSEVKLVHVKSGSF